MRHYRRYYKDDYYYSRRNALRYHNRYWRDRYYDRPGVILEFNL